MLGALVANGNFFDNGPMVTPTVARTRVNGMPVVDAAARCVSFNDLYTHDFGLGGVVCLCWDQMTC